ncbi:MAG: hypothetical protein WD898_00690 [Candidatus Paceibacterota bacterium]
MENLQRKVYKCALCENLINEERTQKMFEGDVPDVNNCDLSTYSEHRTVGGKLFRIRPTLGWISEALSSLSESTPVGGICDSCLTGNETVKTLEKHLGF